jgi:hypothetical protein
MASNCLDNNLLAYAGTSQSQRLLNALASTYAQVDERTAADLILFVKKYGAYLNYYDATNSITGNWQPFMSNDPAVIIANVADWRTKDFMPFIESVTDFLQTNNDETKAQQHFKTLFDLVFTLATNLDNDFTNLTADITFKNYLGVAIASNLALPLNTLWQYYNAFKASSFQHKLIDETLIDYVDPLMPVDNIVFAEKFNINNLSASSWIVTAYTAPPITLDATAPAISNINIIVTHNLFTGALQSFLNGVINIVSNAPSYLDNVLENYSLHQPHYALYLSFLRLFQFAQTRLNEFTQEHLDFYYKDVLQLSNNVAEPDFVHLLFDLQKNVSDHALTANTLFKAGKDANNNDLFYALTDDVVLHQASVQSLKSLYLSKGTQSVLYASPVANSEDGNGAKLQSADNSWYAFGNINNIKQATIGLAIASNVLYLNEGSRTVQLTFQCDNTSVITSAAFSGKCSIQFTGKKNWFDPSAFDATSAVACNIINTTSFSLTVTIPGNAPAIIPYSAKIHEGNFTEALPMLQLQLNDYSYYAAIKQLNITSVTVDVTASNVKDLSLQNDEGKINPAKPFKPFGEFPDQDSSFIIGSKEIFQKSLTALSLNTSWQTAPTSSETADVSALKNGQWSTAFSSNINISNSTVALNNLLSIPASATDFTANPDYDITSIDGFIKLQFEASDYSLATYLSNVKNTLAQTSVKQQTDNSGNVTITLNAPAVQSPPAPPVLKSISINYSASETISLQNNGATAFANRSDFFYHIEPFGFREMHAFSTTDKLTVLPVFDLDDGVAKDDGGELWVGLNNAGPAETFSVLFEVADGTSNPLKNMTTVNWYYLANNNWLGFDKLSVIDQTNNFTRSGIVLLNVPNDATINNTRVDAGLIWIKAVVNNNTDAVCKLISIAGNAAKATFLQDESKDIFFTQPLAANTISKPAVADATLKKTSQPYPSFDGRVAETDDQFYIRVSERLRHKHRAVTAWDYERLVLQNYPQIHKVKCINHTGLIIDNSNNQKYSETLPGHVTVITIPDLTNNNTANPLQPYTSVGLLTEIQQYLQNLNTPFVMPPSRLHVLNPQFEEVQFNFSVTFMPNYDETFYIKQLNTDIEQFLTPWAFNTGSDIEFGGIIEKSVVLNFVEERSYVDYVTCFTMNQVISRNGTTILQALYDVEEAVASTARSILVSYNDGTTKHIITSPANCDCNA